MTEPTGALHPVRAAICLDLMSRLFQSVRPRRLRHTLHFLRNEMILSLYAGEIPTLVPDLDVLIRLEAHFAMYPDVVSQYLSVSAQNAGVGPPISATPSDEPDRCVDRRRSGRTRYECSSRGSRSSSTTRRTSTSGGRSRSSLRLGADRSALVARGSPS